MSSKLKVALIQTSLVWENPDANRNHFHAKISSIEEDTDLVVLPEMFNTGFTMNPDRLQDGEDRETLEWMKSVASDRNMALVGSIPYFENSFFTNRLLFILPDGTHHGYDKRHTFTLAGEDKVYRAGNQKLIVDYKGFSICPLICYDLRFPVWARNVEEYEVLLYVANWPKPRIAAWDALLKARAIENMAYCIGVNRIGTDANGHEYPGHSAVYDGLGNTVIVSTEDTVLYALLEKEHLKSIRGKLNFLRDRDNFTLKL